MSASSRLLATIVVAIASQFAGVANADTKADPAALVAGKKLVADSKCEACHAKKVGGDGSSIYRRADRRVTTRSKLLPQVALCNSELSLGLFPDDEVAIATYLNTEHYRFKD